MNYLTPMEAADAFRRAAIEKEKRPFTQFALMAILGGAFIAFGGLLTVMVAGGMPGVAAANPGLVKFVAGALFPIGLIMVAVTGADLFTSDCAGFAFPLLRKELSLRRVAALLLVSYLFNFVGAQLVAWLLSAHVGMLEGEPWRTYLHGLAGGKVEQAFWPVFVKGIGANWLVCLGMLMGYAAKDIAGKSIAIWIPIMLFVTLGYEHSIANMFFIPAAIYTGAEITWSAFILQNLIPATLGNIVGGMGLVGMVYGWLYLVES
jgi:formate/nitrite transporter